MSIVLLSIGILISIITYQESKQSVEYFSDKTVKVIRTNITIQYCMASMLLLGAFVLHLV